MLASPRARFLLAGGAVCAAILAYVGLRYGDAVGLYFFLDDFWVLRDAARVRASGTWALPQLFEPSHGGLLLYRPLTQLGYFYLLRLLFGLDPSAYHAFHLLLFGLNACLAAGIVRALTASWGWALAGGLLYAAAPGHTLAVYWLAAATMTGTATVVLAAMLWWLVAPDRWRAIGAGALQVVALGASEHAIALPLLLAALALLGPRRQTSGATLRGIAPAAAVCALYLGVKLVYFLEHGFPSGGYALKAQVGDWITNLGRYASASLAMPPLAPLSPDAARGIGVGTLVALPIAVGLAWRRGGAPALPALGLVVFVVALLPVLPLTEHYFDYFVGVAALGIALLLVGLCRALPRGAGVAGAALVATVLIADRATCHRVAENGTAVQLMRLASAESRATLRALAATAARAPAGMPILVPVSPNNAAMIDFGQANRVFFDPPIAARTNERPSAAAPAMPLLPAPPDTPVPGADPRWDWLRAAAAAAHARYAGDCR